MSIYERMKSEHERLEKKTKDLQSELQKLPEGKLICARNGDNYYKWYRSNGHDKEYIPKKNRQLAEQLALKKYITSILKDITNEKKAIQYYLKKHEKNVGEAENLLTETSEFKNLLGSQFTSLSQELSEWVNSPYEHNTKYPENLIYKSVSGKKVRSKSEMIIDMYLFTKKIPFRYEAALELDNMTIYPDFTIRHPRTGKLFYWDHFGMMDNPMYAKSAGNKLQAYISNGIIPSIQLITTYETRERPLDSEEVESIIERYFL